MDAVEQFRNAGDQKYLLRQIKAIDAQILGEQLSGAATIVDDPHGFRGRIDRSNAVLLVLYGHRLASGGSFLPAQGIIPLFPGLLSHGSLYILCCLIPIVRKCHYVWL